MAYILNGTFPFIHKDRGFTTGTGAGGGMPLDFDFWYNYVPYGTNYAGLTINEQTALMLSAYWRGLNLIGGQMSTFPINLFRKTADGGREEVLDHPSLYLLKHRPNNLQNARFWRETMQVLAVSKGNGYSYIERRGDGTPIAFKLLNPDNISIVTDGNRLVYEHRGKAIDPYNMLHIPALSTNGIEGRGVLQVAAESMGVGMAIQKYAANAYKNGAKQSGWIKHPQQLSTNAKEGLRKAINAKMLGPEGGYGILDEGMEFISEVFSPEDMQLLLSFQASIQDMGRWFGLPPYLIGDESRSTFTNIEHQGRAVVTYTFTQWVTKWEAELNTKLLSPKEAQDHYFKMNMDSLLRGDLKSRFESYAIGVNSRILRPNEAREKEDMNKYEGGDEFPDFQKSAGTEKQMEDGN